MQTAIQEMISIVEMDFENGVEISMKVFHKMLLKAKEKEKQQILSAWVDGGRMMSTAKNAEQYYNQNYYTRSIPVNLDFKDTICEGCGNYNMQCTCFEKSRDDHFNGLR
jgi:hypothetical protein